MRRMGSTACALLLGACYAHQDVRPPDRPTVAIRPALLPPTSGRYTITRGGRPVGEERFTITSSAGMWRAEGVVTLTAPAESAHGYVLQIDESNAEPVRFEVWVELYGERRRASGVLVDGFFEVRATGIGGDRAKKVPYAAGTNIDFDSPLFNTLVLSLLGPKLVKGRPVTVRTIVLPLPELEPTVMLTTYELIEREDDVSRVVLSRARTALPVAMWVRPDGLPVRTRTFITGRGPPVERTLQ